MPCEKAKGLSEARSQLSAWVTFLKLVSRGSLVPDPSKHNAQNSPPHVHTPLFSKEGIQSVLMTRGIFITAAYTSPPWLAHGGMSNYLKILNPNL